MASAPRKTTPKTKIGIKSILESTCLAVPTSLGSAWLDQVQQRWDCPVQCSELFDLAPTQTRTVTRFTREGLEGRVTGYKQVTVPANSATAKNSTSILRKPANRADFVRGAAGFLPFAPGGLDAVEATAAAEDLLLQNAQYGSRQKKDNDLQRLIQPGAEGALLEVAPGLSRGLRFDQTPASQDPDSAHEVQTILEEDPPSMATAPQGLDSFQADLEKLPQDDDDDDEDEDIDALLPVEYPALEARGPLALSNARRAGREWAHMVDVNRAIPNFRELVPDMARDWPFELDTFQKEAVYHLESGDSVFVAAHTSAGKTVVAEYAIALAAKHMTKAIYTSPIKALSNQKFRDFRTTMDDVGILTGDVQIKPEASCLIMTTEILRSMLYRGADLIRDVEFVIFDEVHYVNDLERGVVWEEVIIMLPEHVTLILLSATVPNTYEFASWVGRTKKKDIYVISTPKRPVPLEHYLWAGKDMYKIVNSDKQFIEAGWKKASDSISGKDKVKSAEQKENTAVAIRGGGALRGGDRGRGQNVRGGNNRRGAPQQRGRGQPAQRGHGNIARTGRGGGRTTAAQDRNIWVHIIDHLRKNELLPCCIFVFSKRRCEENADALSNKDFCTASEKSTIHMILEKSLARLKVEDRQLPQIRRLRELLARGIAVHHGGLLPIVKECVEILFAKTLVKILFATETFAMGLNLPTRTVVFSGFRKHDGRQFRDLLPGEYTQMAGRAGRRGLDTVGSVVIVSPGVDEAPPAATLRQMMLGDPTKLRSQFRLTYNMILNLLRVEALKIEEMIKRSFSENATQALLPEHEQKIKISEADLLAFKREPCDICDKDLNVCHDAAVEFERLTTDLYIAMAATLAGKRMFTPQRLIVYRKDGVRTVGMLLREGIGGGSNPSASVLEIGTTKLLKRQDADLLPYLPKLYGHYTSLPKDSEMKLRLQPVPVGNIECLTRTTVQVDVIDIQSKDSAAWKSTKALMLVHSSLWKTSTFDEMDLSRLRELKITNILEARSKVAKVAQEAACLSCSKLEKHFAMCHDEWLIKDNITQLRQLMSDQNLQLLPDYEQRIGVLKDLGFIDEYSRVELKGKMACEIHSADEMVLTELILENVLADFEPAEIVALLSSFVFQEKTDVKPNMTPALERGQEIIVKIAEKVNDCQIAHQVIQSSEESNDFVSRPRFGLVEVVYEWARGMSFNRITELTDVLEGTIVRVMTRLDETCREVKNAARIIGDPTLFAKMEKCQESIRRDICATASLYV